MATVPQEVLDYFSKNYASDPRWNDPNWRSGQRAFTDNAGQQWIGIGDGQDGGGVWNPSLGGSLTSLRRSAQDGSAAGGAGVDLYFDPKTGQYTHNAVGGASNWDLGMILSAVGAGVGMGAFGGLLGGAGGAVEGGSGAFLGEAPWTATGGGALDFGAGTTAAGAGAGAGVGGGSGAFLGEGVASGVPAWDAAATGAGLSLTTPALAAGGGLLSGAGSLLGPAATLLGAAAGSQPQKSEQNSTKSMDPRMDALFYGDLAPRVQGLLAQQQGYVPQGAQQLRNVGLGLLGQGAAPNGFDRFTKGRY